MTLEKFEHAAALAAPVIFETRLVRSQYFSAATGNDVYFKPENMQFTGSFKVRGAYYKIATLTQKQREAGLIAASAGNHAQGVAYAAGCFGIPAVIVMPTSTPYIKVSRTESYGARVVLCGDDYDAACRKAREMEERHGYTFIHPFDDETVATGQGTLALEILNELPDADILLVPVGGGGLAAGVAACAKQKCPGITVIGVEPAGADCMAQSLKAGRPVELERLNTIADGTAVRRPGDVIFPCIQKYVDEIITVDDSQLVVCFLEMIENQKMIVENAGLLSVAALKHLKPEGKKVVSILSGGNMDVITLSSVVQHALISCGRIFTLSVLLPDKPGELVKVASVIAFQQGNVVRIDHNQFVSLNRNDAVELQLTMETFGLENKNAIMKALADAGYNPVEVAPKGIYR